MAAALLLLLMQVQAASIGVDADGDGVDDSAEDAAGLDPTRADTDADGVPDGTEGALGTDPRRSDSDGDGLSDGFEHGQLSCTPAAAPAFDWSQGRRQTRAHRPVTVPQGHDQMLLAVVATSGQDALSGLTWQGQALSPVAHSQGEGMRIDAWQLAAPAPGTGLLQVTWPHRVDAWGMALLVYDGAAGLAYPAGAASGLGTQTQLELASPSAGARLATVAVHDTRHAELLGPLAAQSWTPESSAFAVGVADIVRWDPAPATASFSADADGRWVALAVAVPPATPCASQPGLGTDPLQADTDADGLGDGAEHHATGTDPLRADTDGDAVDDGDELTRGTDPLQADSDADGLDDGQEAAFGTDPLDPDSDGGGRLDGAEVLRGTDPLATHDDLHAVVWSLAGSHAQRASPMDVAWVGDGPTGPLGHGHHEGTADLHVRPQGGQWLSVNGTPAWVHGDFRFMLPGFDGAALHAAGDAGAADTLSFDGTSVGLVVQDPANETELVRTKLAVHTGNGTLRLSTYEVLDDDVLVDGASVSIDYALDVPVHFEFDVWKRGDDLTETGVYQVGLESGSYQGHNGTWLVLYNEDPVIYQWFIPLGTDGGPVSGIHACVQTEMPVWCGGTRR